MSFLSKKLLSYKSSQHSENGKQSKNSIYFQKENKHQEVEFKIVWNNNGGTNSKL